MDVVPGNYVNGTLKYFPLLSFTWHVIAISLTPRYRRRRFTHPADSKFDPSFDHYSHSDL